MSEQLSQGFPVPNEAVRTPEYTGKWPASILFVRHGETEYNRDKKLKRQDDLYRRFKTSMEVQPFSDETKDLARQVDTKYPRRHPNWAMPLTERGEQMAFETGIGLREMYERGEIAFPDVIYLPPLARNRRTLEKLQEAWPALAEVKIVEDERIREKDFGVVPELFSDQGVYLALHEEELRAKQFLGDMADYVQRYPGGENVPDMMLRMNSYFSSIIREYAGKNVWIVGNHLLLLSMLALLHRWKPEEYVAFDHDITKKPVNCGVSIFKGKPEQGKQGKLVEEKYNLKLYQD